MNNYLLTIGDQIKGSGPLSQMQPKFDEAKKAYDKSGGRPSLQPKLWQEVN